ncbi:MULTISPECIES: purine-cytosine permease family protein [Achromobacter]|uniref:purine-cytosine permease family protein n=1 Tax=Achromobacter TaxID=222 RepID=UPI000D45A18C|nr:MULTISPECIES: cytosine permease [Achromobacter]PTN52137.1 cytosine permease [Achromobacter xylosoxidans]MBD9383005.1 cytosine permease [Achromobacter sp. ACM02]MBD9471590.1 cytosine permease [Achromobacter sp. ACM01]MDQ1761160.1 cytosine permease [Achromobacter aegrifaciens]RIJ04660.1 cytosine permease [Achromobacter sp. K91]
MTQDSQAARGPLIERRSIDFIPETERHGKLYSQFTLWMGANLQITAIITGALAVVLGGDVFWSLIGLFVGQVFGGAVMALHAAQGPKLGLPQMISSRVQFGVYGAAIPIVLVCLMYLGFTATGTVLSGQALGQLFGVSDTAGILIFAAVIAGVTLFGYRMIHIIGRIATVLGIIAFFYLFSRVIALGDVGQLLQIRHFTWSSFLLSVSLAASWQIAYGPYVADYSRYLPSRTSSFKTFLAVGLGSVLGAQIAMVLGVLAAAMAAGQFAGREVAYIVGLGGTGAMAALLYFTIAFGKVTISTLNSYGSFMCIATIASGFRGHVEISRRQRALLVLVIVAAATAVALIGQHSFLNAFKSFILFLLAFFVPWSAVNLVDYYFVSREQYDVEALSDPNGRYGRWNWPGILIYLFGVLVQMPFISTKLYTGPMVERLGGVDISWIIGLVVPSILYYLFARRDAVPQPRGAARATHTL